MLTYISWRAKYHIKGLIVNPCRKFYCTSISTSPIHKLMIKDTVIWVKRDDLRILPGCLISGNKARKFKSLVTELESRADKNIISLNSLPSKAEKQGVIVSYGGPQSNAMLAVAKIAHYYNFTFVYFVKRLPAFLLKTPNGNLKLALDLGMVLESLDHHDYNQAFYNNEDNTNNFTREDNSSDNPFSFRYPQLLQLSTISKNLKEILRKVEPSFYEQTPKHCLNSNNIIFIPQGGADIGSKSGVKELAEEINSWWHKCKAKNHISMNNNNNESKNGIDDDNDVSIDKKVHSNNSNNNGCDAHFSKSQDQFRKRLCVLVPSGTGTVSFYLSKYVSDDIDVVTSPSVGSPQYLKQQFQKLQLANTKNDNDNNNPFMSEKLPIIIESKETFPFGKPNLIFFNLWKKLKLQYGLEIDLLYAPLLWNEIFKSTKFQSHKSLLSSLPLSSNNLLHPPIQHTQGSEIESLNEFMTTHEILYVHCGGVEGNQSLLSRYRFLFPEKVN